MKQEEPGIKKEGGKILIDIHHDTYQRLAHHWEKEKNAASTISPPMSDFPRPTDPYQPIHAPCVWYPSLTTEGYQDWPAVCHWLASQGLSVWVNLLIDEQTPLFQWHRGNLQGTSHSPTIKDAVIAALEARLTPAHSAELMQVEPDTGQKTPRTIEERHNEPADPSHRSPINTQG